MYTLFSNKTGLNFMEHISYKNAISSVHDCMPVVYFASMKSLVLNLEKSQQLFPKLNFAYMKKYIYIFLSDSSYNCWQEFTVFISTGNT